VSEVQTLNTIGLSVGRGIILPEARGIFAGGNVRLSNFKDNNIELSIFDLGSGPQVACGLGPQANSLMVLR